MKILTAIPLAVLTFLAAAQEPNPFVKKAEPARPPAPAGAATLHVVESFNVPSDLLDGWLEANPPGGDPAALRGQLLSWSAEKKAILEHTIVTAGTIGRDSSNESTFEQTYPMEFLPAKKEDVWPLPTAFATRNCGYSVDAGAIQDAAGSFRATFGFVHLLWPQDCPFPLPARTRQPADMFHPRFWSIKPQQAETTRFSTATSYSDPFAASPETPPADEFRMILSPDRIHLIGRAEEPRGAQSREVLPPRLANLLFFRGANAEPPTLPSTEMVPENFQLSAKFVKVPHSDFSGWLENQKLTTVSAEAWPFIHKMLDAGNASVTNELSVTGKPDMISAVDNHTELTYPTEWSPQPDDSSFPTAYETRNAGQNIEGSLTADSLGLLLQIKIQQVRKASDTTFRRTKSGGQWIPDITLPLFVGCRINTPMRIEKGKWFLAGSGTDFSAEAKADTDHCILMFVKVE